MNNNKSYLIRCNSEYDYIELEDKLQGRIVKEIFEWLEVSKDNSLSIYQGIWYHEERLIEAKDEGKVMGKETKELKMDKIVFFNVYQEARERLSILKNKMSKRTLFIIYLWKNC